MSFLGRIRRALRGPSPRAGVRPPTLREIDSVEECVEGVERQEIALGRLGWRWGDLTDENALVLLCQLARAGYSPVFEFGTFRGRTTYNLALNSERGVVTVDAGPMPTHDENIASKGYGNYEPGEIFLSAESRVRDRIEMIRGDSTRLDFSKHFGRMGMVIVDGGHSYDVCASDSRNALRLVREGGIVIWDDYDNFWPGVKRAVDEIASERELFYLKRQHLVIYRNERQA